MIKVRYSGEMSAEQGVQGAAGRAEVKASLYV